MTDERADRLMVIDGHSMAFRAFHALPDSLTDPDGAPVQAVYGFINMLFRLLDDHRPRWLAVAFDEGRSFRHEHYDAYKAGREEIDPDVARQVTRLRTLLDALDVWQVGGAPFEADDYIATLATAWRRDELASDVLIVSGDRDLFQLVGDGVRVLYPVRGIRESTIYDAEAIRERYGIAPEQLTDFKALVGDPSDNIPGVPGIGEKTAAKLLDEHGDLGSIIEHRDGFTPALKRNLTEHEDDLWLSRRLVELRFDAPLDAPPERLTVSYEPERAAEAMRDLGFDTTIERLPEAYASEG